VKGYQSSGSLLLASAVRTAACPVWPERDGGGTEQMRHAMAPKRINWIWLREKERSGRKK